MILCVAVCRLIYSDKISHVPVCNIPSLHLCTVMSINGFRFTCPRRSLQDTQTQLNITAWTALRPTGMLTGLLIKLVDKAIISDMITFTDKFSGVFGILCVAFSRIL